MTVSDIYNSPAWVGWLFFAALLVLAVVLLSGRGDKLLAAYNSLPPEEKARYDKKTLCRITGVGMLLISAATFALLFWADILPAAAAQWYAGFVVAIAVLMLLLMRLSRRKDMP